MFIVPAPHQIQSKPTNGPSALNFFSNRYKGEGYTTLVIVYDQYKISVLTIPRCMIKAIKDF